MIKSFKSFVNIVTEAKTGTGYVQVTSPDGKQKFPVKSAESDHYKKQGWTIKRWTVTPQGHGYKKEETYSEAKVPSNYAQQMAAKKKRDAKTAKQDKFGKADAEYYKKHLQKEETVTEAKKIASAQHTDHMGTVRTIHHYADGSVRSIGNKNSQDLSLSNHAFKHRGGTAAKTAAVTDVVKGSKNSADLAKNLNKSNLGHTNWVPVKEETINEAKKKVEIRKTSTNEPNVSKRSITYDIYVNGKYETTKKDVTDAMDLKKKLQNEGTELDEAIKDPKLAAQVAARKAQRAKNVARATDVAARKKAKAAAPAPKPRAPKKVQSDIRDASERNIIMQLRKAQDVGGNHEIEFRRDKGKLDKGSIDTLLRVHDSLQKPDDKRRLRIAIVQNSQAAKKVADQFQKKGIK